jgi:hypothetical protein
MGLFAPRVCVETALAGFGIHINAAFKFGAIFQADARRHDIAAYIARMLDSHL